MDPLQFHPILKRIRWGGRRLADLLGKPAGPEADYAESWELCDRPHEQTIVADGPYAGWTLGRLVHERGRELFGSRPAPRQFPLLVKLLDAHDRLSLQVHPNDAQACICDPAEQGKTEAWVILEADPGSRVFAGLKPGVDREQFAAHLQAQTVEQCLHWFAVRAGDCIYIPAGTVHAISEGILLAEVQQPSDLTFRLHDWGRVGADGRPRTLHVASALDCIDFTRGPIEPCVPRPAVEQGGQTTEELVACPYFTMRRHRASHAFPLPALDQFRVLMVLEGELVASCGTWNRTLARGATLLVPAAAERLRIEPQGAVALLEVLGPAA